MNKKLPKLETLRLCALALGYVMVTRRLKRRYGRREHNDIVCRLHREDNPSVCYDDVFTSWNHLRRDFAKSFPSVFSGADHA